MEILSARAYESIGRRLKTFSARSLLFLHHIDSLSWYIYEQAEGAIQTQGQYLRDDVQTLAGGRHVLLESDGKSDPQQENWLLFERPVPVPDLDDVAVEIAFQLQTSSSGVSILPASGTELVVYFPTEKETHLGFLLQGPYQTTPARDNIPVEVPWNRRLIEESAELIKDTLRALRDADLLTVSVLQALPIRSGDFAPRSMFRPIYDTVREALRTEPLLPTVDGTYARASDVKLARGSVLLELFPPRLLGQLFERDSLHWLTPEISEDRTPDLYRYLAGFRVRWADDPESVEALVPELVVEAETVGRRLTRGIVACQPDDWLIRLYAQFSGLSRLRPILTTKEILRLDDGRHVALRDANGNTQAYLPPREETDYPIIRRPLAADPRARAFLEELGLEEPDAIVELLERVLPKYHRGRWIDLNEHFGDIGRICAALEAMRRRGLANPTYELQDTSFLLCVNAGTGAVEYRSPRQVYVPGDELRAYFGGNPEIWFLDEDNTAIYEYSDVLGIPRQVAVAYRSPDSSGCVTITQYSRNHVVRGLRGFDPSAEIPELQFAVEHPSVARAAYLWNVVLAGYSHLIQGDIETVKPGAGDRQRESRESAMGTLLLHSAWLPAKDGTFHEPRELSVDDLPDTFRHDEGLAAALNMRGLQPPEVIEALRRVGLSDRVIRYMETNPRVADELEEFVELKENQRAETLDVNSNLESRFHFSAALEEKFQRPGATKLIEEDTQERSCIRNPAVRRERVQAEIEAAQQQGRVRRDFARVPATVWEQKDNSVRTFLQAEYLGHCQVCGDTFPKTDGTPYFEGLYLVPRLQHQWLERPGNVLCLCSTCCAKLQFGAVEADDLIEQIMMQRMRAEGGTRKAFVSISLLGEPTSIWFSGRHLVDLQEMIRVSV